MKSIYFILPFFFSCTPYTPPVSSPYENKIEVSFNNQMAGDYYIQYKNGNNWQNVLILRNLTVGTHVDTIDYNSGQYRIITVGDSSNIFYIK